ncbi:hypothetical protein NOV18_08790 [Pseudomonas asiatica]|uniref:Uncharacterized protein n=1 Tax=Pseudomonas asiatica TaxID=2219225 RepID=A0AAJ5LIL5_9PSED|nr:hypothetical protein [Pseudomonas asiatica]UUC20561.1 hypothetical protein NOV18_08790 [Pseudomonas asiatica]
MDKRLSAVYACLAVGLAMVTAVSVAMTIFNLIDDPMLAVLFSGAAVFLDIFKYLGWPLAMRLISQQRVLYAGSILICVATLGMVSGWSTYDRLMSSIEVSQAKQSALVGGRIEHLTSLIKKDSNFIDELDKAQTRLSDESSELRARGIVTKAQELEIASLSRIDTQRTSAMERIKANSMEITGIRALATKASSVPLLIAALLCAGFALSLELVPALIFSYIYSSTAKTYNSGVPESVSIEIEKEPNNSNFSTETSSNQDLLSMLLSHAASVPAQTKIKVKEFAAQNHVGNLKACAVFKEAEILGAIKKTRLGYLTTPKY